MVVDFVILNLTSSNFASTKMDENNNIKAI